MPRLSHQQFNDIFYNFIGDISIIISDRRNKYQVLLEQLIDSYIENNTFYLQFICTIWTEQGNFIPDLINNEGTITLSHPINGTHHVNVFNYSFNENIDIGKAYIHKIF